MGVVAGGDLNEQFAADIEGLTGNRVLSRPWQHIAAAYGGRWLPRVLRSAHRDRLGGAGELGTCMWAEGGEHMEHVDRRFEIERSTRAMDLARSTRRDGNSEAVGPHPLRLRQADGSLGEEEEAGEKRPSSGGGKFADEGLDGRSTNRSTTTQMDFERMEADRREGESGLSGEDLVGGRARDGGGPERASDLHRKAGEMRFIDSDECAIIDGCTMQNED